MRSCGGCEEVFLLLSRHCRHTVSMYDSDTGLFVCCNLISGLFEARSSIESMSSQMGLYCMCALVTLLGEACFESLVLDSLMSTRCLNVLLGPHVLVML